MLCFEKSELLVLPGKGITLWLSVLNATKTFQEEYMMTFDWQALEDRLFEQSTAVLRQFAAEHPEVLCSFFAYDTNPAYGEM
jgi:hypothetical protein